MQSILAVLMLHQSLPFIQKKLDAESEAAQCTLKYFHLSTNNIWLGKSQCYSVEI